MCYELGKFSNFLLLVPKLMQSKATIMSTLTEPEVKLVQAIFESTTGPIDADWTLVAQKMGLKDKKCARERWRQICVRRGWRAGSAVKGKMSTTGKKKAAREKSGSLNDTGVAEDQEDTVEE